MENLKDNQSLRSRQINLSLPSKRSLPSRRWRLIGGLAGWLGCLFFSQLSVAAPVAVLASDGVPQLEIVIGSGVGEDLVEIQELEGSHGGVRFTSRPRLEFIREMASLLADYLEKISGAEFEIARGNGLSGIALGVYTDFPELQLAGEFDPGQVLRREEYLIRTHEDGIHLIGATELALQHAVWDFLYRLGHRQFFPGPHWEIIPNRRDLSVSINSFESPDYHTRVIRGGFTEAGRPPYHAWCERNRAVPGFPLNTTHEYNRIRSRNQEAFAENPDFFAQVDGERKARSHAKFNVAHPELRQLVVDDAIQWFEENPNQVCKSMDPSDHGGWCEAAESAEIGTPSDQAVFLANTVAEAVNRHFSDDRYVGMYAYYQHDRPPEKVRVDPRLIVSFATDFLPSGEVVEDFMAGWREMGMELAGIREYHSYPRAYDVPYLSTVGASLNYLARTIAPWHREQNASFYTTEAIDNWGCNGLSQYVTARLLWDTAEVERIDQIIDDFLELSFGPARPPMTEFYAMLNGDLRPRFAADGVGRMYFLLEQAWELAAAQPEVRARLADLILFTRYLELLRQFELATPDGRQSAFEQMIRFIYRIRDRMMVDMRNLYMRDRVGRGAADVAIPEEAAWSVPEADNPWKSSQPFSESDLQSILDQGQIAYAERLTRVPSLQPVQPDFRATEPRGTSRLREAAHYVLYAAAGEEVAFSVRCNTLRSSHAPFFLVMSPSGQIVKTGQTLRNQTREFVFTAPETGTYRINFEGTTNTVSLSTVNPFGILLKVMPGLQTTFTSFNYLPSRYFPEADGNYGTVHFYRGLGRFHFKVPAGVETGRVLVYGRGGTGLNATLRNPAGEAVEMAEDITEEDPHLFTVERADPQAAEIWSLELARPSNLYFGDFYVTLGPELPPVLAPEPEMVFGGGK